MTMLLACCNITGWMLVIIKMSNSIPMDMHFNCSFCYGKGIEHVTSNWVVLQWDDCDWHRIYLNILCTCSRGFAIQRKWVDGFIQSDQQSRANSEQIPFKGVFIFRRELRPFKVSVHLIEPGFFKTNITNAERLLKEVDKSWDRLPKQTQIEYGTDFVEGSKAVKTYLDMLFLYLVLHG